MIKQVFLSLLIASAVTAFQADNTERNKRDRDGATMTAEKQGSGKEDIQLAARIRRAVLKDKSLSTNAHNVKIVVNEGQIWLRGPVSTEAEKDRVLALAKENAAGKTVKDFLEIAKGEK